MVYETPLLRPPAPSLTSSHITLLLLLQPQQPSCWSVSIQSGCHREPLHLPFPVSEMLLLLHDCLPPSSFCSNVSGYLLTPPPPSPHSVSFPSFLFPIAPHQLYIREHILDVALHLPPHTQNKSSNEYRKLICLVHCHVSSVWHTVHVNLRGCQDSKNPRLRPSCILQKNYSYVRWIFTNVSPKQQFHLVFPKQIN